VHYVYTSNTLRLLNRIVIFCFQRLLPNDLFHAIQSIQIEFSDYSVGDIFRFRHDIAPSPVLVWTQTWQEIAKMKGLKRAQADLVLSRDHVRISWKLRFSSQDELARGVNVFQVSLSLGEWAVEPHKRRRPCSFTVTRVVPDSL
jgi:hypothetical protein